MVLLLSGRSYAQNEDKIKAIFEASDQKKLVKATKLIDDADVLIEAANQLYLETFAVQGNYDLDEKTKKKKVTQLEGQARQKITEASALYQKGNEIKYGLYKTYIEKFWSGYEGDEASYVNAKLIEEQSNDFYYQALTNRTEANKMPDGNEKIQKLTQANEAESQAIDKQITALGLYYGIDLTETMVEQVSPGETYAETDQTKKTESIQPPDQNQPPIVEQSEQTQSALHDQPPVIQQPDTNRSGQVVINQQMIEMYNRYVASLGQPGDSLPTTGFANMTSFDIDRILQLWYAYLNGTYVEPMEEQQPTPLAEALPDSTEPVASIEEVQPAQQQIAEEGEKIAVVDNERQAQQIAADENVIYRVQVAANKTVLSQRALQRIYYGNKTVEMLEENGWYKYSVGDFATFADANKFRKSCAVKNSFIVAYRKGKRFMPGGTEEADLKALPLAETGEKNMPAGLVFRIQVAAARAPLTKEQIVRIYPGHYSLERIEEEGWYKYQLMGVRLYSDALNILKDIPIKGIFISAYEDGNKINLYQGVIKNRNLEKTVKASGRKNIHETEYHVQLAASKYPIKQEDFSRLYSGSEPIAIIIEEGWYKYRIKAGNSYDLARKIKADCGVDKAFIIAYKRALKVDLYQAIHDTNP